MFDGRGCEGRPSPRSRLSQATEMPTLTFGIEVHMGNPGYDLDGDAAVGAIGTDITERKRAEETVRRLAAAIEGLSENFALYGPDDRLIMCNRNYRELNKSIAGATVLGVTFKEHLRAMVRHGLAPQAVGREKEWIKERMERHRNPRGPSLWTAADDPGRSGLPVHVKGIGPTGLRERRHAGLQPARQANGQRLRGELQRQRSARMPWSALVHGCGRRAKKDRRLAQRVQRSETP